MRRDIQKRLKGKLNNAYLFHKRYTTKQKEATNTKGSREIFSRLSCFYRFYIEQQIPKPVDKNKRKMYYSGKKRKRHTIKNQIMVNKDGYILHKVAHKKGHRHDYDVYKKDHLVIPKQVVNVVDLGYLGIEKDHPEQLSQRYHIKRKETKKNCLRKKERV